jgi:hypothetical protein
LAAAGLPAVGGENEPHDQKIGIDPIIWCWTKRAPTSLVNAKILDRQYLATIQTGPLSQGHFLWIRNI